MTQTLLTLFVRESNHIEGIRRDPLQREIDAHLALLMRDRVTSADLETFVAAVQPDARLRLGAGMNVRVGDHLPPPGGPAIGHALGALLGSIGIGTCPFTVHREYQNLHPFTDGNGRSGRALWLWMMGGPAKVPLGFLHHWYYQSLDHGDRS